MIVALAALFTAVFSPPATEPAQCGLALANKQLVCYRHGASAWVALVEPARKDVAIGRQSWAEVQAELGQAARENHSWGGPDFWLPLPAFRLSLWWVVGVALAAFAILARKSCRRGFPLDPPAAE